MRRRHQKSQKFYWAREQPNGNPKAGNEFSKIKIGHLTCQNSRTIHKALSKKVVSYTIHYHI